MYYPILRGRQFELIALRELSTDNVLQGYVSALIEPVKKSTNNLKIANEIFVQKQQVNYLILNPVVGEVSGDFSHYAEFMNDLDECSFRPAFYYNNQNPNWSYIEHMLQNYDLNDCLILGSNDIDSSDINFLRLLRRDEITKVVINDPERNRALKSAIREEDVEFIRQDDVFESEPRNSNFLGIEPHRFTEEHLYYREDLYDGFSDFTTIPSLFNEGGSTPRAVVIHFTYMTDNDQIWIRHFTSNTNDSIANVQGKFGEAATKAVTYCRENGLTNSAIAELEDYYDNGHYPGLGTVKKLSIKNHLTVVADYLRRIG
ncbi:sce7725 family protein [Gilvibacter sp.]|uniref:sce7725 family protein n=1 Tax=Gilvibacter sp. TaxID=2729997 RepID=UPI003F49C7D4